MAVLRLILFPALTWHHHGTVCWEVHYPPPDFPPLFWDLLKIYLPALPGVGRRRRGGCLLWLGGFCSSACFPPAPPCLVLLEDEERNRRVKIQFKCVLWKLVIFQMPFASVTCKLPKHINSTWFAWFRVNYKTSQLMASFKANVLLKKMINLLQKR